MNDGDKLYLLENEHGYTIRIEGNVSTKNKTTLKRQNADDADELALKKQKVVVEKIQQEDDDDDDSAEENRLLWIQQQLNAMQSNANQSYVLIKIT